MKPERRQLQLREGRHQDHQGLGLGRCLKARLLRLRVQGLRDNRLNPPEWVERVPEVVPGYLPMDPPAMDGGRESGAV